MTQPSGTAFVLWQTHLNELAFWCFLFVTLFNLQGARRSLRNIAIILDFIPFVKNFFQKFLTSGPSRIRSNFLRLPRFSVAVKNFFHFSPAQLTTAPTALLEYQILPQLSIPFFTFFEVFFRYPIWARYSIYNVFAAARRHFGDRRRLAQVLQGFPHILCFSFVRWADIIGTIYERGRRFEILEDERRRQ